jgi:phosphoglycolate phosphatase-like HAD superfamily hydrolase
MQDIIIFDFDGVILDSFPDQFKWFSHICNLLNKSFPYSTIEEFKKDYKEPVYPDMYDHLGFDWTTDKEIIWSEYNKHKSESEIGIFNGIEHVIQTLHDNNKRLAIASSNTIEIITDQLYKHNLTKYFPNIIGVDGSNPVKSESLLKPNPAVILKALEELKCEPNDAIYIGDQTTDIIATRRVANHLKNKVRIIAVTYGFGKEEKLKAYAPDYMAHSPQDLLGILLS